MGMIIVPTGLVGVAASYATWKEDTEIVSYSAVWLMESGAAANETGVDSRAVPLTGADLVGTQAGSLAAASGSPPSRLFDGNDDVMTFTPTAMNVISNTTNKWSFIIKAGDLSEIDVANNGVFYGYDGSASNQFGGFSNTGGTHYFLVAAGGVSKIDAATVAAIPTTGIVHMAWWGDDTYVRCGWLAAAAGSGANGQPTKWSDFPANNRVTATTTCAWANGVLSTSWIMRFNVAYNPGKIYYALMSDTCLIDNAA